MKVEYEFQWGRGRIRVETDNIHELVSAVKDLTHSVAIHGVEGRSGRAEGLDVASEYPLIPGNVGCADAIRALLGSTWGRIEARTEAELTTAMKANAVHYPHGTISGLLTTLTRRGELRRVGKKGGSYQYVLNQNEA